VSDARIVVDDLSFGPTISQQSIQMGINLIIGQPGADDNLSRWCELFQSPGAAAAARLPAPGRVVHGEHRCAREASA
jgi:hypothetical protein